MEQVMTDPVHDGDGRPVPHIRIALDELTCILCGETTTEGYCPRRGDERHLGTDPDATLVPTTSYLRQLEYTTH